MPHCQQIDGNVGAFQPIGDTYNPDPVIVLGLNRNLWLEHAPFGTVPPKREQVDGNVAAFQAIDANTVYVLGTDGNLWLEHSVGGKFGKVPPPREQVDGNVEDFQAIDANNAYVLGTDGNLWLEHSNNGKFGQVPPPREQVDGNVKMPTAFGITVRPAYQVLTLVYAPPGTNGGKSTSAVEICSGTHRSQPGPFQVSPALMFDLRDKAAIQMLNRPIPACFVKSHSTTDSRWQNHYS
jgi:hypothetical protein